ncbi:UDP-N-acetylmuramoyl-L-alanyl-D-glutamate--2,6-diaminopimelate ligase [Alkalihalobacillus sp. AL-G]|uniref:UDP-N-acetylmuramoyl-L-alanyl-D-glutamate--2, 6-diaminopimelate ligase n=1 Tax=Alkalihalobacillus sp. AL-G TaxID=2926399 RepID=UPI0027296740|nr:UDP-N-acetylmuramoyl-L-alanyl-D-glutamate--2,6-diaminopimelate ligase [Alkalihalobacillus sp. AL-G]WLD95063.1 UDP-N-acetylmuramoyl-L-alanyl-D-glutamate--2,6-diaminopimelate ligase [Alkalihalobacillus sp. AL-G]
MKLRTLIERLAVYQLLNDSNPEITGIEMDSRRVEPGNLFVCVKGERFDGHLFVEDVVKMGASAIVAEKEIETTVPVIVVKDTRRVLSLLSDRFFNQPTKKLHLIGITGTNGKTTTSHLMDRILQDQRKRTGIIGTIEMRINDVPYPVSNTTPESPVLQKAFAQMVEEKVDTAVMEVSSHALHMGRVRGCDYDIAVFTNLTQDHLDYHQSMDQYLQAKGLLFSQLGNTYDNKNIKMAILNNDDPASEEFKRMTAAQIMTYGIDRPSDISAKNIKITGHGTEFELQTLTGNYQVNMKLIGKFSVYNILAAISAGIASGLDEQKMVDTIEQLEGVPGRFEVVDEGQPFTVIVDYAHTPDSLRNVLQTVQEFAKGKIFVVVGCGGDRDRSKRPQMAKIAIDYSDYAIFTSDNPRTEEPEQILNDMEKGVAGQAFISIVDRKSAIEYAINQAEANDIIVIAGKGHETYQIIGEETFDFDDREVARNGITRQENN